MISNNTKGNPNHDEMGRFSSNSSGETAEVKQDNPSVPATPNVGDKIKEMGFSSSNVTDDSEFGYIDYDNLENSEILLEYNGVDEPEYGGGEGGRHIDKDVELSVNPKEIVKVLGLEEEFKNYSDEEYENKMKQLLNERIDDIMYEFMPKAYQEYMDSKYDNYDENYFDENTWEANRDERW